LKYNAANMKSSDWPLGDKGEGEERSKIVVMDKEEGKLRLRNLG
jgi:hypothetical protein